MSNYITHKDYISTPILFALLDSTVDELKWFVDRFGLAVKKSQRKRELAQAIDNCLKETPETLVQHLSAKEIILLKRLLAGEVVYGDRSIVLSEYDLASMGLIGCQHVVGTTDAVELFLLDETRRLLEPIADKLTIDKERLLHQFIDGWGALCGFIPLDSRTITFINSQPVFDSVSLVDIVSAFDQFATTEDIIFYDHLFNNGKGCYVYQSPLLSVVDYKGPLLTTPKVINGKQISVNVYEPYQFTYDEIINASTPLFAPVMPNVIETNNLKKLCKQMGMSDIQAMEAITYCWIEKQKQTDGLNLSTLVNYFSSKITNQLGELREILSYYTNTLPFWKFFGMSSQQSFEQRTRVMQPRVKANGKIGRNDPCPCGSGKKFKHCCGKFQA